MLRLLLALLPPARSALRARRDLVVENMALRQQLATLVGRRRPVIQPADRLFWIVLRRFWSPWAEALTFVQPETVLRWHRVGFRTYWDRLSRRGKRQGRPPLAKELRDLIRTMASENLWRAPRIHGELLRLGFGTSERSVSRYLATMPRAPQAGQTWTTFLKNHRPTIAAMDFFTVPTAMFRVLHVLLIVHHDRRQVIRCAVTSIPTAAWVAQQLREAFPFDSAPRYMIFDRGSVFGSVVPATLRSMQIEPARISYRSPWQNGVAERLVGTVRRELLDHVIVLNERHLSRLLASFVAYYNDDRTHLGLAKDSPASRSIERRPGAAAAVATLPRVGGLHRRYTWRRAA